jgi:hypothetical protein
MTIPTEGESRAGRAVLLDVLTVLGQYLDGMVVIGGWVPDIRFPDQGHIGSLDVDLAVDPRTVKPSAYASMRTRLVAAGYQQTAPHSGIFVKEVTAGGPTVRVKLDLVTGEDTAEAESTALVQDLRLGRLRGVEVALDHATSIELSGRLPTGEENTVRARVVDVPAFLCLKAFALNERKKEKDAYDVYFCLRHFDGGPAALADACRYLLTLDRGREAIAILGQKFATLNSVGPQWAARVVAEQGEDAESAARDAFERATMFLDRLSAHGARR